MAGCLYEETLSIQIRRKKMAEEAKAGAFDNDVKKEAERLQAEWENVRACSAMAPRRSRARVESHRPADRSEWPGPGRCIA
jgi:hypothetical protein